jgi:hypothetical protein
MATITPQTGSGQAVAYAAASGGGDTVAFGSATNRPLIIVRNASGSSVTVTLAGMVPCSLGFTHSLAVTCPVGDTEIVPPPYTIDPAAATRGNVNLSYSAVTSVTVGALTA